MNRGDLPIRLRVIKLGGSLFDLADLGRRLWTWLDRQSPAINVVVAGGGACADVIRQWAAIHSLDESFCHEQCGRVLSLTARLALRLLSVDGRTAQWASTLADVRNMADGLAHAALDVPTSNAPAVIVLDAGEFLLNDEPGSPDDVLPQTWDVTSDSIAARVAVLLDADELVLCKSTHGPLGGSESGRGESGRHDWVSLAQAGFVDRYFPHVAPCVRQIQVVDIRAGDGVPGLSQREPTPNQGCRLAP